MSVACRVIEALAIGPTTVDSLAIELDTTPAQVRNALWKMQRKGYCERVGTKPAGTPGRPPVVWGLL